MNLRRTPGGSIVGALFLLGLIAWLLSLIWVYLLVGAAVALVGWVTWTITRNLQSARPAPRMVVVDAPRTAATAPQHYIPLVPIDPHVFDDAVVAEAAALSVFGAWMRQLPMSPSEPSDLVRSLELRTRKIGRLVSEVAQRRVAWREAVHRGATPITAPRLALEAVDPWATTPAALMEASRYVAACDGCASAGTLTCSACRGTTMAQCSACNGQRKAYGLASNGSRRLMNCKACKAKGEVPCTTCDEGKVVCASCQGSGRRERWIEIEETCRGDVQVEPDGEATRAYPWGRDGVAATREVVESDARVVDVIESGGPLSPSQIAGKVPTGWLDQYWQGIQPKLQPTERVRSQTLWLLDVPSVEVAYSLPGKTPTVISFEGRRMLAPPPSLDPLLVVRADRLRLARRLLLGLSVLVPIAYLLRGSYYQSGWVLGLSGAVIGVAVAAYAFMRDATIGRRSARRWGIATIGAAALSCGFAIGAEPSLRAAARFSASGRLAEARAELTALGHEQAPAHAQAWADLHLAEALKSDDIATVTKATAAIPASFAQRDAVARHLHGLLSRDVSRRLSEHKPREAAALLDKATPVAAALPANDLVELQARIRDEEYAQCTTEACQWRAAWEADRLARTTGRARRLSDVRSKVIGTLGLRSTPGEASISRLRRLDELLALSTAIAAVQTDDEELKGAARQAAAWATSERGRTSIVGADREVAAALLGVAPDRGAPVLRGQADGAASYCAIRGERCVGLYVAALGSGAVALNDAAHAGATVRLLSQATGGEASMPDPPRAKGTQSPTTSTWRQGGVPITARWKQQNLIELRIGDAAP